MKRISCKKLARPTAPGMIFAISFLQGISAKVRTSNKGEEKVFAVTQVMVRCEYLFAKMDPRGLKIW